MNANHSREEEAIKLGGFSTSISSRVGAGLLVLPAFLLLSCGGQDTPPTIAGRVDAVMTPLVAAHEFSGAVVLVRSGELVYQRGFGMANHAEGLAFTPDTPTDGGSMAKTFTAAGLWWLVHEQRVSIDALTSHYLPHFPHPHTTVGQLLTHSNGLPPYYEMFDPHFKPDEIRSTKALLAVVAREFPEPGFVPGSRFEYSNLGYDTAVQVIEQVTGQSFEDYLVERFFTRLVMDNSFARPARLSDWQGVRTLGYRWKDNAWKVVDVFDLEAHLGASNIYFSAADLARWASANATGKAIPAEVLALGQQRSSISGQPSPITGLSWYCDSAATRCYYTGSINAFHSFVYWDRAREEAVVYVSNSSLPPWPAATLARDLVAVLAEQPLPVEEPVEFLRYKAEEISATTGRYVSPELGIITLAQSGDSLWLRVDAGLAFDVFQVSRDAFYVPGPDYWLAFSGERAAPRLHLRSVFVDTSATREEHP